MHELPIIESVLKIVLQAAEENRVNRVVTITLKVGEMRDFIEEFMQRYFDYCTRGTIAEGAKLEVVKIPITVQCKDCGQLLEATRTEWIRLKTFSCKSCGSSNLKQISGSEFTIEDIGVV